MYDFVDKLKEIKGAILKLRIFETILDALVLFLIFSLILLLLRVTATYAIIPSFIYVLFRASKSRDAFQTIEGRYSNFRERLRAAYDNREKDNIVVRDLSGRISEEMEGVRYSSFISGRKVAGKILLSVLLSFLILFLAFANFKLGIPLEISKKSVSTVGEKLVSEGKGKESLGGAVGAGGRGAEEEIFGEPSIAKIEGEKLSLELYPGAGENKLRDMKERKFSEAPLLAAGASPAEAFSENVPQKYEEVVRGYFEKLSEESK